MKRTISYLLFLAFAVPAFSQMTDPSVNQSNAWVMYFGNHRLNDALSLHTEYQWRRNDGFEHWQQSLMRVGLDVRVRNAMITGGYGWIVSFPYGEQPIPTKFTEHRIWQQLVLNQVVGRVYFNHRYRLEQRFLENASINADNERVTDGYRYRNRARYRVMASIPLNSLTMEQRTLFIAAYEEVFLGFGPGIQSNVLDQNRLYLALGYMFHRNANVQLGYLNHHVFKGDGVSSENNHTLQVAVTYNLDCRK